MRDWKHEIADAARRQRIGGDPAGTKPQTYAGPILQDAIKRARTGQGAEMWTGYSRSLLIDSEMLEANRENNTLQWAKNIGARPFMVVVAQYDELINNARTRGS